MPTAVYKSNWRNLTSHLSDSAISKTKDGMGVPFFVVHGSTLILKKKSAEIRQHTSRTYWINVRQIMEYY